MWVTSTPSWSSPPPPPSSSFPICKVDQTQVQQREEGWWRRCGTWKMPTTLAFLSPSRSVLPCPERFPGWDVEQALRSGRSQLLFPFITNTELLPRGAVFCLLYHPHLMDLEPFLPNSLQHFPIFICRDFIGHHFHVSKNIFSSRSVDSSLCIFLEPFIEWTGGYIW